MNITFLSKNNIFWYPWGLKWLDAKQKRVNTFKGRNFGTAGKQIEKTFLTCIVALNNGKK